MAVVLPTWLPESPGEPSQESPMETSKESPVGSPEGSSGESPAEPPADPTTESPGQPPSLTRPAWPNRWRSPGGGFAYLPLPRGIASCWVVPRSGKAGGKKTKRPVLGSTPKTQETSPQDNVPPKERRWWCAEWPHTQKSRGRGSWMGTVRQWAAGRQGWASGWQQVQGI